jgi:NADH-quinone oxidoreductase subunit J
MTRKVTHERFRILPLRDQRDRWRAVHCDQPQPRAFGAVIGLVILMQFVMAFGAWDANSAAEGLRTQVITDEVHNTAALGLILYDQYFLLFQLSGLILLVAMIGAIVLTLRHRADVKRQNVVDQMMRDPKLAMKLNDVKPGQGL